MEVRDQKGLTEREFLEAYAKKNYPRPYLTADLVLLAGSDQVLLVKRKGHPYLGCWALPGGFASADETVEQTAARELLEETGVRCGTGSLIPVGLYSKPGRDPRGWVVSQAYLARVSGEADRPRAGDDAAEAAWFRFTRDGDGRLQLENDGLWLAGEALAFDHGVILDDALRL